jgi:hypothetical protein
MKDLWPKEIKTEKHCVAPLTILKEQAALLGGKTSNIVKAEVIQKPLTAGNYEDWAAIYHFELTAPAWGGYRYVLFRFFTDIPLYPVAVEVDMDIAQENLGRPEQTLIKIRSQKELEETLVKIFSAGKTKEVINALLIHSGAEMSRPSSEQELSRSQGRRIPTKKKPVEPAAEFILE